LRDKAVLLKFLKNNADELRRAGGVFDVNETVRLMPYALCLMPKSDGRWLITVPMANKLPLARKVKFNKELIAAMHGMEFFGSGKTMEATFTGTRLEQVVAALTEITQLNALPSLRPLWERAGGNPAPKAVKTFADRPTSNDTKAKQGGKETADNGALFSRSADQKVTPISPDAVERTVGRIVKRLRLQGIPVNIVATEADLPTEIQPQAGKEGARGEVNAVHFGVSIYIVADRMESIAQVEEAVFNESAHFGGRFLFVKDFGKAYQNLWLKLGGAKSMKAMAKKAGFNMDAYFKTADDLLSKGLITSVQRASY